MLEYINQYEDDICLLVDSGAFTAWRAGTSRSVEQYADFLEGLPVKAWRYFALDVIGDAAATRNNLQYLVNRKLNPIPIFTRGEDICNLDKLYEISDLIGIGGLVGTKGSAAFINGIMKEIGDRKAHWLGFARSGFIKQWHPYSCDCCSWMFACRYKTLHLYQGFGRFIHIRKQDLMGTPKKEMIAAFAHMGFDHAVMRHEDAWINSGMGYNPIEQINMRSWVRFSLDIQSKVGSRIFLAISNAPEVKQIMDQVFYWRKHWDIAQGDEEQIIGIEASHG